MLSFIDVGIWPSLVLWTLIWQLKKIYATYRRQKHIDLRFAVFIIWFYTVYFFFLSFLKLWHFFHNLGLNGLIVIVKIIIYKCYWTKNVMKYDIMIILVTMNWFVNYLLTFNWSKPWFLINGSYNILNSDIDGRNLFYPIKINIRSSWLCHWSSAVLYSI